MLGEVVGESGGIEATAAQPEPLAERFGRREKLVRYRESDFHTVVLPWYEMAGKLANQPLQIDEQHGWLAGRLNAARGGARVAGVRAVDPLVHQGTRRHIRW
jgi:hypothetical protein